MKRKSMPPGKDKRKFSKNANRTHKKNVQIPRGGYRL